jgi:hypothetical protein
VGPTEDCFHPQSYHVHLAHFFLAMPLGRTENEDHHTDWLRQRPRDLITFDTQTDRTEFKHINPCILLAPTSALSCNCITKTLCSEHQTNGLRTVTPSHVPDLDRSKVLPSASHTLSKLGANLTSGHAFGQPLRFPAYAMKRD